jgi:hypothetical protein
MKRHNHPWRNESYLTIRQEDHSAAASSITVFFKHLEERLIEQIDQADAVFGCVAWLTSERILAALSRKWACSIIVNKQDFRRPDEARDAGWQHRRRELFDNIKGVVPYDLPGGPLLVTEGVFRVEGVRCLGSLAPRSSADQRSACPLMHHKFVVFCKVIETEPAWTEFHPYAVWTGWFNFTKNAPHSLENEVLIKEPTIVWAYFNEWIQCLSCSESLDWTNPQADPEWVLDFE